MILPSTMTGIFERWCFTCKSTGLPYSSHIICICEITYCRRKWTIQTVQKIYLTAFKYVVVKVWLVMVSFLLLLHKKTTRGTSCKANFFFFLGNCNFCRQDCIYKGGGSKTKYKSIPKQLKFAFILKAFGKKFQSLAAK